MKKTALISILATTILTLNNQSLAEHNISLIAQNNNNKDTNQNLSNIIADTTITAAIKTKFITDDKIGVFDIHVETVNGVVTLTGSVNFISEMARAISIAKNTEGVTNVIVKIVVR